MIRSRRLVIWLLLCWCAALYSFSGLILSSNAVAARQVFALNNFAEPETLDPGLMTGIWEQTIVLALFEGLTVLHPKTLEPLPGVARSWKIEEGGLRYTFNLRSNAKWSNGQVVTAFDFVRSWQRLLTPATKASNAHYLYAVVNAEEYHRGLQKDFGKVGVRARSDRILEVQLKQPTPNFLFLTSFFALSPVHLPTIKRYGKNWTKPGHIVTNGPFRLYGWQPNQYIKVRKFFGYWDAKNVRLDEVIFYPISSRNKALELYMSGAIQWTGHGLLPDAALGDLRKRADYYEPTKLGTYFLRLNTKRPPLDNLDVRRALFLSIDRKQVVRANTYGGERPAHSFTPPGIDSYKPPHAASFNPALAVGYLAKAGYCVPNKNVKDCKKFPSMSILFNNHDRHQQIFSAVIGMWEEHLGISSVTLIGKPWKDYLKSQRSKDYMISRSAWIADVPDPINFLELFNSMSAYNSTGWVGEGFDDMLNSARLEVNPEKRLKVLYQAEAKLLQELPVIPLFHHTSPYLLHSSVEGFYDNVLDVHNFKSIYRRVLPTVQ